MKQPLTILGGVLLVFSVVGMANATLWDRPDGLVYDDVLNITWLADANYAARLTDQQRDAIISDVGKIVYEAGSAGTPTQTHFLTPNDFQKDADGNYTGLMTWWGAMGWAMDLKFQSYNDWRLPSVWEMRYLSDNYGGSLASYFNHTDHFTSDDDIQAYYWSNEVLLADPPYIAKFFWFEMGSYRTHFMDGPMFAFAVRDGDVHHPVPEPATMLLLASGLVGIAGFKKRFTKQ
jgi:hypothetical protein